MNAYQPDDPDGVNITNAGDLTFRVDVQNDDNPDRHDGYVLNVYERDDSGQYVPTPFVNLVREKQSDGTWGSGGPGSSGSLLIAGVSDPGDMVDS